MGNGHSKEDEYRRRNEELLQELRAIKEREQRLENEKRDLELETARAKNAESEAELRRATQELEKAREESRLKEELQKSQERERRALEQMKMEKLARTLEHEAKQRVEKEVWLRKEAERLLKEGIPPIQYPTGEEIAATRETLDYREGYLHIAITGYSGTGKSSLINAVRGYQNAASGFNLKGLVNAAFPNPNIARTGANETTKVIKRYPDPHHSRKSLAWYDVPGAGTIDVRDWQYFNTQGLYIFDVIMIAVGDRIASTDVELLFHCKRFGIPTFFVRSKADQHIRNCMDDCNIDENEARIGYVEQTREKFNSILKQVGLPPQKIYIVSKGALQLLNDGKKPKESKDIIDEEVLIKDITDALHKWSTAAAGEQS